MASEINLHPRQSQNPEPFVQCLTRDQKEKFEICYEENAACHRALKSEVSPPSADWQVVAIAIFGGVIGGMVLSQQLRH